MTIPTTPVELLVEQLAWARYNIKNNLDFVPIDKADWKPSPTSKSVLEIVTHLTGNINFFSATLLEHQPPELTPPTTLIEAKALVTKVVDKHIATIQSLTQEQLTRIVKMPFGEVTNILLAGIPVTELINHHGQIT